MSRMTPEARALILGCDSIRSHGFGELVGSNDRAVKWSAAASFCKLSRTWHLSSIGDGAQVQLWPEA